MIHKVHAQNLKLAQVDEWDVPKVSGTENKRRTTYEVTPTSSSSSDSESSISGSGENSSKARR